MRMTKAAARRVMGLLALGALLAGVVVMHHVATASPGVPAPVAAADDASPAATSPGTGHADPLAAGGSAYSDDLLHLCVALSVSAAIVALVWPSARRRVLYRVRWPRAWIHRLPRLRPPRAVSGAALLTSICVMRT